MATTTYVPIATQTLNSNTATVTFGSGGTLSQAYTDLVLVVTGKSASGTNLDFGFRFNGDTGTNYSRTYLYGNGSSAASGRTTSASYIANLVLDSTNISVNINHFMNYSNTTTHKTVLFKYGLSSYAAGAHVGVWRNTNAITQIDCLNLSGTNFASGTTFTLYGIANASAGALATGGIITDDSTYYYHTFISNGTFTPKQSLTADILVVAGGGGAGSRWGGGGGAGGLLAFTSQALTATNYTCTIGSGGAGGGGTPTGGIGTVGADSQFGALTLVKGGGWGTRWLSATNVGAAGTGGSGGGATSTANGTVSSAGAQVSGQGYPGGAQGDNSAGGGGAGGAGNVGSASKSGDGGIGSSTYSSWCLVTGNGENVNGTYYLAGGGGGGTASNTLPGGLGGYGGGGAGNNGTSSNSSGSGRVNTGGGGGGAGNNNDNSGVYGGSGGSGLIIIRYAKP